MHLVANYELFVSRAAEDTDEVLLLTVERADLPSSFGAPQAARLISFEGGLALEVSFEPQTPKSIVLFPDVPANLAESLAPFKRLWLVFMANGDIVAEAKIPLSAGA